MLAAQEYPRLTSVNEQQRNFTLALISHLLFALLFIFFIPLHLIDNDHGLGIRVFQGFIDLNALGIFQDNAFYSETGERFFRLVLFFISFALVWGLYSVKLITPSTLGLYFMWPYAAYLATRMKVEFIVFPFYMIRTDLKWRHEALLIMAMLVLGELIGERNFQLFAIFGSHWSFTAGSTRRNCSSSVPSSRLSASNFRLMFWRRSTTRSRGSTTRGPSPIPITLSSKVRGFWSPHTTCRSTRHKGG